MNSIPGREPRPDRSRYQSTQRNPQRGCYLALTFGTLLSSQGADAQQLDPRGLSSLATFPTVRRSRGEPLRGFSAAPGGLGGAIGTKVHDAERRLHGGSDRPCNRRIAGSGDAGRPELDAHPWADRPRRLRDAVLPGALARAAHDDEV